MLSFFFYLIMPFWLCDLISGATYSPENMVIGIVSQTTEKLNGFKTFFDVQMAEGFTAA